MDLLKQAVQRNKRIVQIRDLLLLLLRAAAILLFAMAIESPGCRSDGQRAGRQTPLHAILLVDNSMSMGYQALDGTMLARAQKRAADYIETLPEGSMVTIIPLCGSRFAYSVDPYRSRQAASEALGQMEVVDRSANISQAVNQAQQACQREDKLAKRIVLFGDQQRANWRELSGNPALADLPALQVVQVAEEPHDNSWVESLRVQDGLADTETPTTFIATIRHLGQEPRGSVPVTLSVNGQEVASRTVQLDAADATTEVTFQYRFADHAPEAAHPDFAAVRVALPPDRLTRDDERTLIVPIVTSLPVVFVDQYGAEGEDLLKNRLGETRPLRRLLAPAAASGQPSLVQVRHVTMDELISRREELLSDARLVVIAGVETPGPAVELLRQYVLQGGQLLLAAGGDFSWQDWQEAAWLDGGGILPLPLTGTLGDLPSQATENLQAWSINFASLDAAPDYFQLAEVSEEDLRDLYAEPFFFKAIQVDAAPAVFEQLAAREQERQTDNASFLAEIAQRQQEANSPGTIETLLDADERERLRTIQPRWLQWQHPSNIALDDPQQQPDDAPASPAAQTTPSTPKIQASLAGETDLPLLIERRVGAGSVMFLTTGLQSAWNTLPTTNTFLMFDRILRAKIRDTLPRRSFAVGQRVAIPIDSATQQVATLRRPHEEIDEPIDIGFVGEAQRGVTIEQTLRRGIYDIRLANASDGLQDTEGNSRILPVSVEDISEESDLTMLSPQEFEQAIDLQQVSWVAPTAEISLSGDTIAGQNFWWFLTIGVLLLLLAELLILASQPRTPPVASSN